MKKISKLIGFVFAFLVGIGIGVGGLWLVVRSNIELRYYLLERPTGDQPQGQIAAFVKAIVRGDRSTALKLWEIGNTGMQSELMGRQASVVSDLLAAGIKPDYMILGVEWWATCCEPRVICDSQNAGGARILVQFMDKNDQPLSYTFDIFNRDQPYWGGAEGYPSRDWVIRDVYLQGQKPLFWTLINDSQIRNVQP